MKFYGRENEKTLLETLFAQADDAGKMTVITGRRRVGKTLLSLEFAGERKFLYLFVSRKSEHLLVDDFIHEIKKTFNYPIIGIFKTMTQVFELLLEIGKNEKYILIIDEFQEFNNINPSVYGDIQKLWDLNKQSVRMHVIFSGSVYSIMKKIFEHSKEPLFGRADRIIVLKPFTIITIRNILLDYGIDDYRVLTDFHILTGGMPKYIDMLVTNNVFTFDDMVDFVCQDYSPFLHEGKHLLIEELGKEYATYFSILSLLAAGKTTRPAIESLLETKIGGFLDRMQNVYELIQNTRPINAKPKSKKIHYEIIDNFIRFWFRFIHKYSSAIETGNFKYLKTVIKRDYPTYSGLLLEKFFRELFMLSGDYNKVGGYWEMGNKNEIDLVAVNDMEKSITIAEVKRNRNNINLSLLKEKSISLLESYKKYKVTYRGLSFEDIPEFLY